jgi:hypothetical protein
MSTHANWKQGSSKTAASGPFYRHVPHILAEAQNRRWASRLASIVYSAGDMLPVIASPLPFPVCNSAMGMENKGHGGSGTVFLATDRAWRGRHDRGGGGWAALWTNRVGRGVTRPMRADAPCDEISSRLVDPEPICNVLKAVPEPRRLQLLFGR